MHCTTCFREQACRRTRFHVGAERVPASTPTGIIGVTCTSQWKRRASSPLIASGDVAQQDVEAGEGLSVARHFGRRYASVSCPPHLTMSTTEQRISDCSRCPDDASGVCLPFLNWVGQVLSPLESRMRRLRCEASRSRFELAWVAPSRLEMTAPYAEGRQSGANGSAEVWMVGRPRCGVQGKGAKHGAGFGCLFR